ncbi:dual specificity protein phosphatase 19-like isoform X2 [Entelurus aequoreus]|uniref:dual specificity protein phosphatase 19-like isoform X2 n=1 Tax=Entelurus aequoreus TaxID=161455 RepID=UPI002B1E2E2F|nr:dual specificity protein phosphatase 19-like isoform X2 [Entelurus aequoreus]
MQSLAEEIQSFSRTRLKRQCTRVTSLSGRRIIETWKGSMMTVVDDPAAPEKMLGYVPDASWDLQVGVVKPYLLLGSQDAAHDFSTLRRHKVSHILNVAFGVENVFPDLFVYKTVSILDQPDTDLVPHLQECCDFILQARAEGSLEPISAAFGRKAGYTLDKSPPHRRANTDRQTTFSYYYNQMTAVISMRLFSNISV